MTRVLRARPPGVQSRNFARLQDWGDNVTAIVSVSTASVGATMRYRFCANVRMQLLLNLMWPRLESRSPWLWLGLADGRAHLARLTLERRPRLQKLDVIEASAITIGAVGWRYVSVRVGPHPVIVTRREVRYLLRWLEERSAGE